jgi:transcriptional regulator with XRE-family HTH domain
MSSDWEARKAQGRERLRALRKLAGMTQEQVEQEAGLAARTLNRIERGTAGRENPEKVTLEAILRAINARYNDQRDVLALFGYNMTTPLPDAQEIAWACQVCHDDLHGVMFPAYLLDCANRLLAWNHVLPSLIGFAPQDMELLRGISLTTILFDKPYQLARMVENDEEFLPSLLRVFHHESQWFVNEPWYHNSVVQATTSLPLFKRYWAMTQQQTLGESAARPRMPALLTCPGVGTLPFRLSADHLTTDSRFRIVYYLPAHQASMRQCAAWAE